MSGEEFPVTDRSVRFFGGPLDGRVQELTDEEPVPGTIVRHIHLHGGPKIETLYELGMTDHGWEYRVSATRHSEPEHSEPSHSEPEPDGLR